MRVNVPLLLSTAVATFVGYQMTIIRGWHAHPFLVACALSVAALISYLASDSVFPWLAKFYARTTSGGDFGFKIDGQWWEWPDRSSNSIFISWNQVRYDPQQRTVRLIGVAYNRDGDVVGRWSTSSACLSDTELQLCYYWTGERIERPEETVSGIGVFKFFSSNSGPLSHGSGHFSEVFPTDAAPRRHTVALERATDEEIASYATNSRQTVLRKVATRYGAQPTDTSA